MQTEAARVAAHLAEEEDQAKLHWLVEYPDCHLPTLLDF